MDCVDGNHFIAVTLNDEIIDVNDSYCDRLDDEWREVQTDRDKVLFYILSQIVYPDFDTPRPEKLESLYALVDELDVVFLRWHGGRAIGFYTVKPTGNYVTLAKIKEGTNIDVIFLIIRLRHGNILDEREIHDACSGHRVHSFGIQEPGFRYGNSV